MRVKDPFMFDSGRYSCTILTPAGECTTQCDVEIEESYNNLFDALPEFVKPPLPTVALHGNCASFCTRITPVDSDVTWIVCGREITGNMKDFAVRFNMSDSIRRRKFN